VVGVHEAQSSSGRTQPGQGNCRGGQGPFLLLLLLLLLLVVLLLLLLLRQSLMLLLVVVLLLRQSLALCKRHGCFCWSAWCDFRGGREGR